MNLITTSRKPGKNLRKFVRQATSIFDAAYFVRGKSSVKELAEYMEYEGYKNLISVSEYKGNPKRILIYSVEKGSFKLEKKYDINYFNLSIKKYNPSEIELDLKSKKYEELFKLLGIESVKSNYKVVEEKEILTLMKGKEKALNFGVTECLK